jgi:hypothetical protein
MNWNKLALAATFSLFIFLEGQYTPAQTSRWAKDTSAAIAANQRGEYALAQKLYEEVVELQEKDLGVDNPEVAISLNNLAVFYQDQSMYPKLSKSICKHWRFWRRARTRKLRSLSP